MQNRLSILLGLSLVACSGASSSSIDVADGSAPRADAANVDPPALDGGVDVGAPVDAARDVASNDAARDAAVQPIDPLVVGHKWTYQVTQVNVYPLCPSGTHDGEVLRALTKDGRQAVEVQSLCQNAGTFFYSMQGDVVHWDEAGNWVLVIDAPVQEGHSWASSNSTYTWHDAGAVTVPAGTFSDCWKAQDDNGPSYTTFCRGVGPVDWHYRDAFGNGYNALLTAKNF